ncbi:hypothetical protein N799_08235 [Lysobacter arseniciresistens ZS79]|uniref:Hemin transporter HemP n=1 Tax=Lysobacter arseniciresistens ZS79 TaxID=913325 RepID=A0A0A0F4J5_9GAMM|nr:hemin uptake protein HemP [Lysobacter arseniciresistens]KGM57415.1 hypothetical protein N799_08235 [Lysobacter arseniciresistens ZS79]
MALQIVPRSRVLHLPLGATPRRAPSTPAAASACVDTCPCQFDSATLLRGTREVLIRHGGETYRLRHTRNDKLILTK